MERKLLADEEIANRLEKLAGWRLDGDMLKRRFEFRDFTDALAFVNRLSAEAERLDHHPDITFGWGYAEIATTTHDRGGITDMDMALAEAIDSLGPTSTI
jgi:4a-hydroxytetrahydrobiopterin dehydratase